MWIIRWQLEDWGIQVGFFAQKEKLYFACGLSYAVIKRYAINNSRIFDLHDKKDGDTLNWNYYVLLLDGEGLRDKTSLVLSILEGKHL